MCGINGIYSLTPIRDQSLIERMNSAIIHRGPDEEGTWSSDCLALGMRRLSIIDLSDGHQPMISADGRFVLIFNGEIYNYRRLRSELEARGVSFRTNSDTEVILQAFWTSGPACFPKLEGMFAIAIYDTQRKELFLCRDRLGKKPLYYLCQDGRLIFASEIKSLLAVCGSRFDINYAALSHFFQLSYIPAPHSIYEGIHKLPPASYMRVAADLSCETTSYWDLKSAISPLPVSDPEAAQERLKTLLTDCVLKRMVADVPLGLLLSGGVDSSIVAGIMARHSDRPIRTFSVANTVKSYDESEKARTVAKLFRTDHVEWVVKPHELCEHIYDLLDTFDEPFSDMAAIPFYIISRKAAAHVKVVLTGDGGDEMFGGYTRYLVHRYAALYGKLPALIRQRVITPLLAGMPTPVSLSLAANKLRKLAMTDGKSDFEAYFSMLQLGYSPADLARLFACELPDSQVTDNVRKYYEQLGNGASAVRKAQFCDTVLGLEGQMLAKVDRSSMRASIEVRCPFIDHRMAEFAFSLPDALKIDEKRGQLKLILKRAFAHMFPAGFLEKPKLGFGIPMAAFLRRELAQELHRLVGQPPDFGPLHFKRDFIKGAFDAHLNGRDRTHLLWPYFVFARWFNRNSSYLRI